MPRHAGCYEVDLFTRGRVVGRHERGESIRSIAKDLSISKSAVHGIVSRFRQRGVSKTVKRSGRLPLITTRASRLLVRSVLKSRRSRLVDIAKSIGVSSQTARRELHKLGYHGRVAKRKPYLTEVHIRKRWKWAQEMSKKDDQYWENVIFSDESKFELFGSKRRVIVWRRPGEEYHPSCLRGSMKFGGGSVMVWAAIWISGRSELVFVEDKLNSDKYIEILENYLMPIIRNDMDVIFQDDGAPCHSSKKTKKWKMKQLLPGLPWAPQIPDMNPIEHVWDYLDRELRKQHPAPSSKEDLKSRLKIIWEQLDQSIIDKMILSMPNRVAALRKAHGGPTRY